MKQTALALLLTSIAFAQVAEKANSGYKTPEQRATMAKTLGDPHRDAEQRPAELVAGFGLKAGMTVADIGTGVGYLLPHLSKAVGPSGKVIGEDIFPDFLEKAKSRASAEHLANTTFVLGDTKDPKLPAGALDFAVILDVYHHFDYPQDMLAGLSRALKPTGRIAIVEFHRKEGAMGRGSWVFGHLRLDQAGVIQEVEASGFKLVSVKDHIPDGQYVAIFEKRR
ncbi:MAG: methyltransferase domain-containing protein [Bryobacteraceae bacterium]